MSRVTTEPRAAFAGVMPATSFVKLRPSSHVQCGGNPVPSLRWLGFCRPWSKREVATRKRRGVEAVRKSPNPCQDGHPPWHRASCNGSHSVEGVIEVAAVLKFRKSGIFVYALVAIICASVLRPTPLRVRTTWKNTHLFILP